MKKIFLAINLVLLCVAVVFAVNSEMSKKAISDDNINKNYDNTFPIMEIDVSGKQWPETKDYYNGSVSFEPLGNGKLKMEIRGRGNGTLDGPKKPYKIKFDTEIALLNKGEAPAKDWVLLANLADMGGLRTYYALECMQRLNCFDFQPKTMFVNLVVNGKYMGVYQLCEQIEVDEARLNIDDKSMEVANGFLIERDQGGVGEEYVDYVKVGEDIYSIKSDIYSREQAEYVQNILANLQQAIANANEEEIRKLMDVDSSVDMYIMYEFSKNIDVGWGSFYMFLYPNNSVLQFGPAWDFDLAFGNDARLDDGSYEGIYVGNRYYEDYIQAFHWYYDLMEQEWYQELVKERWNEIKPVFLDVNKEIQEMAINYADDFKINLEMWPDLYRTPGMITQEMGGISTYEEYSQQLFNWIDNRYKWLDNYFNFQM